jgi:hypothetical protein
MPLEQNHATEKQRTEVGREIGDRPLECMFPLIMLSSPKGNHIPIGRQKMSETHRMKRNQTHDLMIRGE